MKEQESWKARLRNTPSRRARQNLPQPRRSKRSRLATSHTSNGKPHNPRDVIAEGSQVVDFPREAASKASSEHRFGFLDLPGEVRNLIYGFIPTDVHLAINQSWDECHVNRCRCKLIVGDDGPRSGRQSRNIFALRQTCRTIYDETRKFAAEPNLFLSSAAIPIAIHCINGEAVLAKVAALTITMNFNRMYYSEFSFKVAILQARRMLTGLQRIHIILLFGDNSERLWYCWADYIYRSQGFRHSISLLLGMASEATFEFKFVGAVPDPKINQLVKVCSKMLKESEKLSAHSYNRRYSDSAYDLELWHKLFRIWEHD